MHFAEQYIGIPYLKGGQDKAGFDCWGLFRFIQKEHYGLELPFIDVDADNILAVAKEMKDGQEKKNWTEINTPTDGCAVLMAHARFPSHVGVWLDIDGGGVLHAVRGIGVVFSSIVNLRLSGWGRIEFYEYLSRA